MHSKIVSLLSAEPMWAQTKPTKLQSTLASPPCSICPRKQTKVCNQQSIKRLWSPWLSAADKLSSSEFPDTEQQEIEMAGLGQTFTLVRREGLIVFCPTVVTLHSAADFSCEASCNHPGCPATQRSSDRMRRQGPLNWEPFSWANLIGASRNFEFCNK